MKLTIQRESILKPLQLVSGVVERRQTLPILSNLMLDAQDQKLFITATDLEVELIGCIELTDLAEEGKTTVNARKFTDICRTLPNEAEINLSIKKNRLVLSSGRSRFTLSLLDANEFPNIEESEVNQIEFSLPQNTLKALLENTHFAMAQQDVRYYLNGMLFYINQGVIRLVSADGHRLALGSLTDESIDGDIKIIVPRKGVIELMKLLEDDEERVDFAIGSNHIRMSSNKFTFTSKLVDGQFPSYETVVPKNGDKIVIANREKLKHSLTRVSILSNEKYRGIRFALSSGILKFSANNPEQEEAEEELEVDYNGADLEIGFNVNYLIDICNTISSDEIKMVFHDSNSAVLIEQNSESDDEPCLYVVMPMRL